MKQMIERKLKDVLEAESVEVIDDSARHDGHVGAREGGNSHFKVKVISNIFGGMSRIERHRKVYSVLKEELDEQVHALNIVAKTPEEEEGGS